MNACASRVKVVQMFIVQVNCGKGKRTGAEGAWGGCSRMESNERGRREPLASLELFKGEDRCGGSSRRWPG